MNYLDAFGDEIYSRYAEIEWPEVLILDALGIERAWRAEQRKAKRRPRRAA